MMQSVPICHCTLLHDASHQGSSNQKEFIMQEKSSE